MFFSSPITSASLLCFSLSDYLSHLSISSGPPVRCCPAPRQHRADRQNKTPHTVSATKQHASNQPRPATRPAASGGWKRPTRPRRTRPRATGGGKGGERERLTGRATGEDGRAGPPNPRPPNRIREDRISRSHRTVRGPAPVAPAPSPRPPATPRRGAVVIFTHIRGIFSSFWGRTCPLLPVTVGTRVGGLGREVGWIGAGLTGQSGTAVGTFG